MSMTTTTTTGGQFVVRLGSKVGKGRRYSICGRRDTGTIRR